MYSDDPSPFKTYREAAEAVADAFIGENMGGPGAIPWRKEHVPKIEEALRLDGHLPNWYEVDALNGGVPEDGSDPEQDLEVAKDYGCPDAVAKKFPNTDRLIASQF